MREFYEDGSHRCELVGCEVLVPYDDEPYCFTHSPDNGAFFQNYSYKQNTFEL